MSMSQSEIRLLEMRLSKAERELAEVTAALTRERAANDKYALEGHEQRKQLAKVRELIRDVRNSGFNEWRDPVLRDRLDAAMTEPKEGDE
jgi:mevalonate pyrophosphate decarboxylase